MTAERFVIVGGGLAAATAAEQLRTEGFGGTIRMLGAEPHLPYLRPPLSKGYFTGTEERETTFVHPDDWYREHNIEVTTSATAVGLDTSAHIVTLADATTVPYEKLLIATGAQPRRLGIPGSDAAGIHYLRTVEDSETLRTALKPGGKRVVFVGAGWIGLEIAAAARGYDNDVVVVAPERVPLSAALGDELGQVFQRLHESHGVQFRMETATTGFEVVDGRVSGVITESGAVPADLVVVGIGAVPSTALAEAGGLAVDNGIVTDASLISSAPDVFAAGDVASSWHPVAGTRLRNEHWANAIASGKVAARSMLGQQAVLDDIPYFYTDQYDLGMEYSGYGTLARDAAVVYRGDRDAREFITFWLLGGRVVAGMNVNVWDVNEAVQGLIGSGRTVDSTRLVDSSIDLADV